MDIFIYTKCYIRYKYRRGTRAIQGQPTDLLLSLGNMHAGPELASVPESKRAFIAMKTKELYLICMAGDIN